MRSLFEQAQDAAHAARYAEAESFYRQAILEMERDQELGPEHPDLAPILMALGEVLQTEDRFTEAEQLYKRALAICDVKLGPEHPQTIAALRNVAGILDELQDGTQAETLYREALTRSEHIHGSKHVETALSLATLARYLRASRRYEEAEPLYQRALEIYGRQASEAGHYAICLNNYAVCLLEMKRPVQAELVLRRALLIGADAFGSENPNVASALKNLGRVYEMLGEHVLARTLYQRSLLCFEHTLGPNHSKVRELQERLH